MWSTDCVDDICTFASACHHVIGPLAGTPIELQPFQVFILANLFGWLNSKTGLRRYREAFILLPRGNAKSTLAAIIALHMCFREGQPGAEGLSGAGSLDQAMAVWTPARLMVENTPGLADALGIETTARSIFQVSTNSSFKPVISAAKDGGLPFFACADEVHQSINDVQLSAFRTGMGKRRGADPLLFIISTAGTNTAGVCRTEQLYFEQVLAGTITDDAKFGLIYTLDKEDSWRDFKCWKKANPNYGVSVDEEHLRREYEKALNSPAAQAMARTKYLNEWVSSAAGWLNTKDWADAGDKSLIIPPDARAFIGVDLSTKTDITAVVLVAALADGTKAIKPFLMLPAGALERSKNAKAYQEWIDKSALIQTEGEASDFGHVEDLIRDLCRTYSVEQILFDPWQSAAVSQRLAEDGMTVGEFRQTAAYFGPVMVDFEADLMRKSIIHDANPALAWMAGNVVAQKRGNLIKPDKPSGQDHLKIDGIVATLMAYAASNVAPPPAPEPIMMMWL